MNTLYLVLYTVAAVLFLAAGLTRPGSGRLARFDLVALGLAVWVSVSVIQQFRIV